MTEPKMTAEKAREIVDCYEHPSESDWGEPSGEEYCTAKGFLSGRSSVLESEEVGNLISVIEEMLKEGCGYNCDYKLAEVFPAFRKLLEGESK